MFGITQTITWGILYYSFSVFLPSMEAEHGWSRGEMSGALAPVSAGAFFDVVGSYDPLFWGFVWLSVVSAGVVLLVRSDAPSPEPEVSTAPRPATR